MALGAPAALPTLYEYYTNGGINSGLNADNSQFTLNDRNISLYSGAMHYFRIPKQYWRDRLRKLRAAGLNTVETYVPWNLHEPQDGVFDFGNGGTDFQDFLDVQEYLKIAQEEDLFAIVRSGPYICAEWEWGGLPSWLLKDKEIKVRTSNSKYMDYVKRYFGMLLPLLTALQFTNGGPIIAFQVENEYGGAPERDLDYLRQLVDIIKDNGVVELLVSSDSAGSRTSGSLPDVIFQTVNFGSDPTGSFNTLKTFQPNRPIMAMEYWTGWFDHWSEHHHTVSSETFRGIYETILAYPASVNMYMFHGGTNWGFLNGANIGIGDNSQYQPTTSSYDYDAPLSEAGDYTEKYDIVKELLQKYNTIQTLIPEQPTLIDRVAYPSINIEHQIKYNAIIDQVSDSVESENLIPMEQLPINNNSGQSYGYIVYRKQNLDLPADSKLTINGHIRDTVMVLVNGALISEPLQTDKDLDGFGFWRLSESSINLTSEDLKGATVDIVIENWGRGNYGNLYNQYKGLGEDHKVLLNGEELSSWIIYPLEFKKSWISKLSWDEVGKDSTSGPTLYQGTLTLDDEPTDTFVNMEKWHKGVVFVNGFALGRYTFIGPQQTLYLPGPLLKTGDNEIVVFEQFDPSLQIEFSEDPIFDNL